MNFEYSHLVIISTLLMIIYQKSYRVNILENKNGIVLEHS